MQKYSETRLYRDVLLLEVPPVQCCYVHFAFTSKVEFLNLKTIFTMTLLSRFPLSCAWIITALVVLQPGNAHEANAEICSWSVYGSPFPLGLSTCALPIDDKTAEETGNWAPWSHRPYCVTPANWPKYSPRLCVFTAANFRGQNGLSLLATPELAASIADSMDDSLIPPDQRDHPASPLSPSPDLAYTVEELPGRGKGIVASRKIRKWETVLLDFPAIIVQRDYHSALNKKQKETMLQKMVNQLPDTQRDEVLSLSRDINGEMIEGILRSNVFSVDLTQVPFALYPRGSVSHDHADVQCIRCLTRTIIEVQPCLSTKVSAKYPVTVNFLMTEEADTWDSAYWRFSKASLAQEFIAMQDIEPGEEVTQSCEDTVPIKLARLS
jgi:hypothetical protein